MYGHGGGCGGDLASHIKEIPPPGLELNWCDGKQITGVGIKGAAYNNYLAKVDKQFGGGGTLVPRRPEAESRDGRTDGDTPGEK